MKYLQVAHLTLEKIFAAHPLFGWARLGHLTIDSSFVKVDKYKT